MGYAHACVGRARESRYTEHMIEVVRRSLGFAVAASLIAYFVFVLAGASLYAQAEEKVKTVWVRDEITPNTHRLAGLVTVPSSCTELHEKTIELSPLLYKLVFTTWEHPNTECLSEPVQKAFHEIVFAPASRAFSISSFTAEEGCSSTSPAAI